MLISDCGTRDIRRRTSSDGPIRAATRHPAAATCSCISSTKRPAKDPSLHARWLTPWAFDSLPRHDDCSPRAADSPSGDYGVDALLNVVHAAAENTSTLATMTGEALISTP